MLWGLWAAFDLWSVASNFLQASFSDFTNRWAESATWFEGMRKNVEPVTWVLGSILALVPGSFAIYKWIYYRYSRLPERLDDMLEKEERRLRDARDHLVRAFQRPAPTKTFKTPIFVVPSLSRALQRLKWAHWRSGRRLPAADAELGTALSEIEAQERYWAAKRANYTRQKATAYLLRGAIAAAHGTKARAIGLDGEQHSRIALEFFEKALRVDPKDHQALEYMAHQQRVLGMLDEALKSYGDLLRLVAGNPDPEFAVTYVRAQRYRGEILWRQHNESNVALRLTEAKSYLEDALEKIPTIARDELDHGWILHCLSNVEWKRRTQLWRQHSRAAETIFFNLSQRKRSDSEAKEGLSDIKRLQREFAAVADQSRGNHGADPTEPPPDLPNGPH